MKAIRDAVGGGVLLRVDANQGWKPKEAHISNGFTRLTSLAFNYSPEAWKTWGALTGSWTGGTANMVAIQGALGIDDSAMGYTLLVDNVNSSSRFTPCFWPCWLKYSNSTCSPAPRQPGQHRSGSGGPVIAATYKEALIPIGVLMALMGYIAGTFGGLMVAKILSLMAGA